MLKLAFDVAQHAAGADAKERRLKPRAAELVLFVGCILILREKILYYVLPIFFTAYLIYGFVRPSLSRAWRREIEEEDDEPDGAH